MRKKLLQFTGLLLTGCIVSNVWLGSVVSASYDDGSDYYYDDSGSYEDWSSYEDYSQPQETPEPSPEAYFDPVQTDEIEDWPEGPKVQAESAIVMDTYTGAVLYGKNIDEKQYPASITKIMTTLVAVENNDLEDTVTISKNAIEGTAVEGSSNAGLSEGEKLTVEQCLMAVMLASANEAAYAIAEKTSGNLKKFVELMNQRARELGCTNTHFNNANGLPDEKHYTSAHDMALIASAAWSNPNFRKFVKCQEYTIPATNKNPEPNYLFNHHKMMSQGEYAYSGCTGGKTGYTSQALNTLVTYAYRKGMTLVCVDLRTNGTPIYTDTAAMLDYGFDNFHRVTATKATGATTIQVLPCDRFLLNKDGNITLQVRKKPACVTVPKTADIKKDLKLELEVLPNYAGEWILQTNYTYRDHPVGNGIVYEQKVLPELLSARAEPDEK